METDHGLAGASRAADPRWPLEVSGHDHPLIGMEEDHPILDRAAHHLGEELGFHACEPGSGAGILELPFDMTILVGDFRLVGFDHELMWSALRAVKVRKHDSRRALRSSGNQEIEGAFERLGVECSLNRQELFISVERA